MVPLVLTLALTATKAHSAAYTVHGCDVIGGLAEGWHLEIPQPAQAKGSKGGDECPGANGLWAEASNQPWLNDPAGYNFVEWVFTSPQNTKVYGFNLYRRYWLGPSQPFGSPLFAIEGWTEGIPGYAYQFFMPNQGPATIDSGWGWHQAEGFESKHLRIIVGCGGTGPCINNPAAEFFLSKLYIKLKDANPPTFQGLQGPLTTQGPYIKGPASLTATANDLGGGLYRKRLLVNNVVKTEAPADPDDDTCYKDQTNSFLYTQPCEDAAEISLSLTTSTYPDGPHTVKAEVEDAAGNKTTILNKQLTFDNTPPTKPTGLSVEGEPPNVKVLWQPSTDATSGISHYLYRYQLTDGNWTNWQQAQTTQATLTEKPLDVEVKAQDKAGNSSEKSLLHIGKQDEDQTEDKKGDQGDDNKETDPDEIATAASAELKACYKKKKPTKPKNKKKKEKKKKKKKKKSKPKKKKTGKKPKQKKKDEPKKKKQQDKPKQKDDGKKPKKKGKKASIATTKTKCELDLAIKRVEVSQGPSGQALSQNVTVEGDGVRAFPFAGATISDVFGTMTSPRLIAGKPTVARVYTDYNGLENESIDPKATVTLRAVTDKGEVLESGLQKTDIPGGDSLKAQRRHLDLSFELALPPDWTTKKISALEAKIKAAGNLKEGPDAVKSDNKFRVKGLNFEQVPSVPVGVMRVTWPGIEAVAGVDETKKAFKSANAFYPLTDGGLQGILQDEQKLASIDTPERIDPANPASGWNCDDIIDNYVDWGWKNIQSEAKYLPIVKDQNGNAIPQGKYSGIVDQGVSMSFLDKDGNERSCGGVGGKPARAMISKPEGDAVAHELGHNFGLSHASSAHGEGGCEDWPDGWNEPGSECLGHGSLLGYYVDGIERFVKTELKEKDTGKRGDNDDLLDLKSSINLNDHGHDFMSYGVDEGTSLYNWNRLIDNIFKYPTSQPNQLKPGAVVAAAQSYPTGGIYGSRSGRARTLGVGALVVSYGNEVEHPKLNFISETMNDAEDPGPADSKYRFVIRDANGDTITEHPVGLSPCWMPLSDHSNDGCSYSAGAIISVSPQAAQIDLLRNSQVIASKTASPNMPTVKILTGPKKGAHWKAGKKYKIRYQAIDPDGDKLEIMGGVRQNQSEKWNYGGIMGVYGTGKIDKTEMWSVADLRPSKRAQFVVRASDGFHTDFVMSNVFRVDPTPLKFHSMTFKNGMKIYNKSRPVIESDIYDPNIDSQLYDNNGKFTWTYSMKKKGKWQKPKVFGTKWGNFSTLVFHGKKGLAKVKLKVEGSYGQKLTATRIIKIVPYCPRGKDKCQEWVKY